MKMADNFRLFAISCLTISAAFIIILVTSSEAKGSPVNQTVFSIDSKPYGLTYGEWTAKWWQWALSIPANDNPTVDKSGEKCSVGQNNSSVWFLAGTGGGEAVRSCTIPSGKAILIPIINVECDSLDLNLKTESDLRKCAKADQDKATNLQAVIDGVALTDLEKYRVQSPLFNVTIPKDNVGGYPPGSTQAVSDGFWILLKPLPPGKHEIHFSGSLVDFTTTGPLNFITDAKYNILVANPP
jgi:hypothetical protein